jgi:hypothetical protein
MSISAFTCGAPQVKAEIDIAPALVGMVTFEFAAFATRQIADAENGIGKPARHPLCRAIDEPDQRR